MTREQINNVLLGIHTDLELFKGMGASHYFTRAKKSLNKLIEARKELVLPIDKHDLNMLQLKIEELGE